MNERALPGDSLTIEGVMAPMTEGSHEEVPQLVESPRGRVPADRPVVLLAHEPVFADTAAKDTPSPSGDGGTTTQRVRTRTENALTGAVRFAMMVL